MDKQKAQALANLWVDEEADLRLAGKQAHEDGNLEAWKCNYARADQLSRCRRKFQWAAGLVVTP
jgi:hypothetical protein